MRCYNHSREVFEHEKIEIFDGSHEPRAAIHKKSAELCSVVADCPALPLILRRAQLFSMEPHLSTLFPPLSQTDVNTNLL